MGAMSPKSGPVQIQADDERHGGWQADEPVVSASALGIKPVHLVRESKGRHEASSAVTEVTVDNASQSFPRLSADRIPLPPSGETSKIANSFASTSTSASTNTTTTSTITEDPSSLSSRKAPLLPTPGNSRPSVLLRLREQQAVEEAERRRIAEEAEAEEAAKRAEGSDDTKRLLAQSTMGAELKRVAAAAKQQKQQQKAHHQHSVISTKSNINDPSGDRLDAEKSVKLKASGSPNDQSSAGPNVRGTQQTGVSALNLNTTLD
ncbi:unnamed protein product [Protopolystoma xenopodis]|uniref:Uncharacterized protein n=1 Tax=Protopolystoma xenopodis TaxID=117903 RepID=A0A3S5CJT6_9PLAT|nr:unnamed protein product [Protopolystoma xenopodis]